MRQRTGRQQMKWDPAQLIHVRRQDAGDRHLARDEAKAPAPEDREPGRRYDTLGEHWQPPTPSS
ncbi:hypothetical protein ACFYOV_32730 [Streptomyces sp. NPDC005931]|uniref:hypothetical protein n=1 Tax=Streptomyces sp. NPDC005931 TaxID=3364737 RepID=UPI0036BF9B60